MHFGIVNIKHSFSFYAMLKNKIGLKIPVLAFKDDFKI